MQCILRDEDIVRYPIERRGWWIKSHLIEQIDQLELRYGEIANDEESAAVGDAGGSGRQVAIAGDSVTAREFASFPVQLDASVVVDAVAATTVIDLEALLIAGHLASYKAGGNPGYALTDPLTAGYFANFALSAGRQRDIRNEKTLVNVIDLNYIGVAA